MRSPSAQVLKNRVSLYRYVPTQDVDAGVAANPYGAAFATSVPCSVQPEDPSRMVDPEVARLTEKTVWKVIFASNYSLRTNDKIVWVDDASVTRTLYVHGTRDNAGRNAAFSVSCEERL